MPLGKVEKPSTNHVKAVVDISFTIYEGETVSIVGESGCGK
ncbi:peptide ABC transporter ATP-binding protein [Jeotgalibacillus soli]|uniref:Peptide ABC transporter ATP-binding protein n=1 Tax=Jeotgalibacillus soli TaxID=889306 RepID=A0A0C2W0D4_9BACL|nr:peptide ABC transporter ATP-binding protein [Jeotgalibacillus soli]